MTREGSARSVQNSATMPARLTDTLTEATGMKRTIAAVLLCVLIAPPLGAQDGRSEPTERTAGPSTGVRIDLQAIVHEKAAALAAFQVPQVPQTPPPTTTASRSEPNQRAKVAYFATLAGAAVGTIYNIKTTREALDLHLRARTFPLVWTETNDPGDKGKVTGIIAGANGALLGVGAFVFRNGNTPLATFINVLVGAGTGVIGLKNRNTINDCKKSGVVCT